MNWQITILNATNFDRYSSEIFEIYYDSASTGAHEQHVDQEKEAAYLRSVFQEKSGYGVAALGEKECQGFLLAYPLDHEPLLPISIRERFDCETCLYIAEMHVERSIRGSGCGSKLFSHLLANLDRCWSHLAIRSWTNNVGALRFYERLGFIRDEIISETKIKKDLSGPFVIQKQYLFKKLP